MNAATTTTMTREHFAEIIENADGWKTIDDLTSLCDRAGYWDREFRASAEEQAKKHHIRRMIKQLKDDDDWPLIASVETTDEEGRIIRQYKQETLFDLEDYRKVATYHAERSSYHRHMALGYVRRCKEKTGKQLRISFGE